MLPPATPRADCLQPRALLRRRGPEDALCTSPARLRVQARGPERAAVLHARQDEAAEPVPVDPGEEARRGPQAGGSDMIWVGGSLVGLQMRSRCGRTRTLCIVRRLDRALKPGHGLATVLHLARYRLSSYLTYSSILT
jgi:hypothetical protein